MKLPDRMKLYEDLEAQRHVLPLVPIMARLDGRAFHTLTAGLARPFDARLTGLMQRTTLFLVRETNAKMGYTQSDEITLTWFSDDIASQSFFNGRIQKMVSTLAAMASVFFNRNLALLPEIADRMPTFDARVWTVPTLHEGANSFLDRELDAIRNSITQAALAHYSHKELFEKSSNEKLALLQQKGIDWNQYPTDFTRGSYFQRRTVLRAFSSDEIDRLPPRHEARQNPDLQIARSDCVRLDMPHFRDVTNRADVIYRGAEPLTDNA